MNASLTILQRDTLERIISIHKTWSEKIRREYPDGMDGKPVLPSEWTPTSILIDTHRLRYGAIKQLIKKGHLEQRSTDGFGPEVRPTKEQAT